MTSTNSAILAISAESREPTAESVAAVVGRQCTIGSAHAALITAGWPSVIRGNRITVAGRVLALFIEERSGASFHLAARWVVYGVDDRQLIRLVVSDRNQRCANRRSLRWSSDDVRVNE